ncbi:phosphopantothenoylcysteine decarboxylase [Bacillus sp. 1P10SD]|uniref:phosphopantothenoylcysteine decarboxylase domain-containing protein n=1 Tax=Bacillus sp. 1P10SD TaxID=3132265 RepID=UPI0039A4F39A
MVFKRKKILVTSGGTLEKWDQVRGHTNLAKGTIGCYIAEELIKIDAQVIFLHGYFSKIPKQNPNLMTIQFEGIEDLQEKLKNLLENEEIEVVIMTAAISDWIVDKIFDDKGNVLNNLGKIPSDQPPIIHFKKAPKVILDIKNINKDVVLVGFKLEHSNDREYLIERALQRMEYWNADYVVANPSSSLNIDTSIHYIVSKNGDVLNTKNKKDTAVQLINTLMNHFNNEKLN